MSTPHRTRSVFAAFRLFASQRSPERVRSALLSILLFAGGCWARNGSYCQNDGDCEQGLCIGYERGVKAGICTESLALSSKQCLLNGTFQDGSGMNRSFGQSVQIMNDKIQPSLVHAMIGHAQGFFYGKSSQFNSLTPIRDSMPANIPYGPSSRLPKDNETSDWIASVPASNQVIAISTSGSVEGNEYNNLKNSITSVVANTSWVAMSNLSANTLWIWKRADFGMNPNFPMDIEDTTPGFGKSLALSHQQIAVGSDSAVTLYDISADGKSLSDQNINKPASAGSQFGSATALSALGLFVSENTASSAGTTVWWYPASSKEAQKLPVPSRHLQTTTEAVQGYGSMIAASDSWIAIGVPGSGSVVLLEKNASGWQEISGVQPTTTTTTQTRFGAALSIDNDWLAVGAPGEGRVYLYRCN